MAKKIVNGEMIDVPDEEEIKPDEKEIEPDAEGMADDDLEADDDEEKPEPEEWQASEDDKDGKPADLGDMPVAAHVRYKKKKKIADEKTAAELEVLRKENEALKSGTFKPEQAPVRPTRAEFGDDETYYQKLEQYEDQMAILRQKRQNFQNNRQQQQKTYIEITEKAVDAHYERAAKVVKDTGISAEVYQETDKVVRQAVESIMPKMGDVVVDQAITIIGEGSEKVLYYLGRNQTALDRFKSLLAEDKSGMKAMVFLGQQKERLTGTKKRRSNAPAPAPNANGESGGASESAKTKKLKKQYTEAHKKGNAQAAFDAKRAAKAAGADVSSW